MKDRIFGVLQKMGHSSMLSIAVLPVAGLLLGIGSSSTSAATIQTYGLERILDDKTMLNTLLVIITRAGNVTSDNLPIIFAVGVTIGMVKVEEEVTALSAVIVFFVIHISINAVLIIIGKILPDDIVAPGVLDGTIASVCGIQTLQVGVFGGIIVGLGVAALHNRYHKITLPNVVSFFDGPHFVPVISMVAYVGVDMVIYSIWPVIQNAIFALDSLVTGTGYVGALVFGIIKRALIPSGLHHVFYMPFWQTAVGGTMMVDGNSIQDGRNILFAQLVPSDVIRFSADATRYFFGESIFMVFGLPGTTLAIYHSARPGERKTAGGLLLSVTLVGMLTGITEPIEFSFLFVAPMLFAVQMILASSAYMITHILNIAVGLTFSGGFPDLLIFGILQGNEKTSWMRIVPVGIIYFLLYCFIFSFLTERFDLKTPDREGEGEKTELYTEADMNTRKSADAARVAGPAGGENGGNEGEDTLSMDVTRGLGGKRNITSVNYCTTRLRRSVGSPALVGERPLETTGAAGVIKKGQGIQVIYGLNVTVIKSNLGQYLAQAPDEVLEEDAKPCQEKHIICSPFNGKATSITEASDEVSSDKAMGDGYMVIPADGQVLAPEDGEVLFVLPSKHAIDLKTGDGMEYLLHIDVDTVKLDGKGFETFMKDGQEARKGQKLMEFDLEYIRTNAMSEAYMAIFTGLTEGREIHMVKTGEVRTPDEIKWY